MMVLQMSDLKLLKHFGIILDNKTKSKIDRLYSILKEVDKDERPDYSDIDKKYLNFDQTKIGQIPFKKSDIKDPHVQQIIKVTATRLNKTEDEVVKEINESKGVQFLHKAMKYAPDLFEQMFNNAVEQGAFDLLPEEEQSSPVKFSAAVFIKLMHFIQYEHGSDFYPLKSPYKNNGIYDVYPIFVPTDIKELEHWNPKKNPLTGKSSGGIETAAATPNGEFIFNTQFMQRLIDFAHFEGVKPKDPKYEKGYIPNEYAYIEFLILHEFLHYNCGDFRRGRELKQFNGNTHNWAMDLRSNFYLVKSGYSQLPMGLFSDKFNQDRFLDYKSLVTAVDAELKKLPKDMQDQAEEYAEENSDDHEPGKDGEPQDGKPSQDKFPGKIKPKRKIDTDEKAKDAEKGGKEEGNKSGSSKGGTGGGGPMQELQTSKSNVKPTYNWKTLLTMCVSSKKSESKSTYMKPARRAAASGVMAVQMGAAAIKPAEITYDVPNTKLIFVFDTSGSMGDTIGLVTAEVGALVSRYFKELDSVFGVTFFADSEVYYEVNTKTNGGKGYYAKIPNFDSLGNKKVQKVKIPGYKTLLDMRSSGGTNFPKTASDSIIKCLKQGYNVMCFSDSDIASGENLKNFMAMYKSAPGQVFFVAGTKTMYEEVVKMTGIKSPHFTYILNK